MALNYRLLDGSAADGDAVNKRQWLQPKVAGVMAVLGVVCISGFLMMPEATGPQAKSLAAPVFLGQVAKDSAVSKVQAMLGAWEAGAFLGKDALENAKKMLSSDCLFDASGPNNPGFKVYSGPEGLLEWMAFFTKTFTVTGVAGSVTAGDAPGQAFWAYSVDVVTPSGEKFSLKGVDDIRVNSAGLVSSLTIYWDVKTTNKYLADSGHAVDPVAIVKSSAEAWVAGGLSGPHAMETAEKFYTEDLVFDASGPNHPAFKVYKGREGLIDFVAVFGKIANITTVGGSFFPGPAPGKVMWAYHVTWSSPTGELFPMSGYDDFTVTDEGKISAVTIYWDVKTVNEYLAAVKL